MFSSIQLQREGEVKDAGILGEVVSSGLFVVVAGLVVVGVGGLIDMARAGVGV